MSPEAAIATPATSLLETTKEVKSEFEERRRERGNVCVCVCDTVNATRVIGGKVQSGAADATTAEVEEMEDEGRKKEESLLMSQSADERRANHRDSEQRRQVTLLTDMR